MGIPTDANVAHQLAECSNAGVCNRRTGECECFPPFTGSACDRLRCPNDCSGHGQCVSIQDMSQLSTALPLLRKNFLYGYDTDTVAWDANIMYGCVCESSWPVGLDTGETQLPEYFGADCSLKRCPSGDDPFTQK